MRVLKERAFPKAKGPPTTLGPCQEYITTDLDSAERREDATTLGPGQEYITDLDSAERHEDDGWAERIGRAPASTPPRPRPLMESGSVHFLEWSFELADGKVPALWREWRIKPPRGKKRSAMVSALGYAAVVASLDVQVGVAIEASDSLRRDGASDLDVELMLGALYDSLLLLTGVDPEHVRLGSATLRHLERVRPAQEPMPGILAATRAVFRPGFTEREAWQALETADGKSFETPSGRFEVHLDRADDRIEAIYQVPVASGGGGGEPSVGDGDDTGAIKRNSFYKYFRRVRDEASGT
jgi:hypothetical protein